MKIIDCFIFYNELDILKIRLHELYDVVDYFILVEATMTHKGNSKPLYYTENKDLFNKYNDKIIHLVTDFNENFSFRQQLHNTNECWYREHYQRECIQEALKQISLSDEDIIILTDLDEIPKKKLINDINDNKIIIKNNELYSIEMVLYYYNIELTTDRKWYQPKIFNYFTCKNNTILTYLRIQTHNIIILNDSGWHLSYFGDENFIKNKVESFAESNEYLTEKKDIKYLKECLDNCILHFNNEKLIFVPLNTNDNVPSFFKQD
jgi:beta-1,4-mannosyl-glycoprotein beta-1,4-N-acetylglucosaminyltransferase